MFFRAINKRIDGSDEDYTAPEFYCLSIFIEGITVRNSESILINHSLESGDSYGKTIDLTVSTSYRISQNKSKTIRESII